VWRALIGKGHGAAFGHLTLRLALHHHGKAAFHHLKLALLCGDDIGQVIDHPNQVGNAFFQVLAMFGHGGGIAPRAGAGPAPLAPMPAIR